MLRGRATAALAVAVARMLAAVFPDLTEPLLERTDRRALDIETDLMTHPENTEPLSHARANPIVYLSVDLLREHPDAGQKPLP